MISIKFDLDKNSVDEVFDNLFEIQKYCKNNWIKNLSDYVEKLKNEFPKMNIYTENNNFNMEFKKDRWIDGKYKLD